MRIICLGISHKTAGVELREKLAMDAGQVARALKDLSSRWSEAQFVIVSTCNRTEIYIARALHGHPRREELRDWLGGLAGIVTDKFSDALYTLADAEAYRHLFSVASGMDSLVPGEAQIVAQLKDAYAAATKAGTTGKTINELFQSAFHTAKHVRSETSIAEGKVSVASVAIDHVAEVLGDLSGKCVLNVGAGKMNELMLKHLGELGPGEILVSNRSDARSKHLAKLCGGRAVAFSRLQEHLSRADIVLTSTAAESPIITREMVLSAQQKREFEPMLIVDLAVPRDVDSHAGEIKNVFLLNIDDMEAVVQKTLHSRRDQHMQADKIIESHVGELSQNLSLHQAGPTIKALYARMKQLTDGELADAREKLSCEEDTEILRRALHRTVRKFLHPIANQFRKSAGTPQSKHHVEAIRKLFNLDEIEETD